MLDDLPADILFHYLLEFLDYETQIAYISCCDRFYYPHMRNHVRRIFLETENDIGKWLYSNRYKEQLWGYSSDPGKQLCFELFTIITNDKRKRINLPVILRKIVDLTVRESSLPPFFSLQKFISCNEAIKWLIETKTPLLVSKLDLDDVVAITESETFFSFLTAPCSTHLHSLSINISSFTTKIPFISSLRSLKISFADAYIELDDKYCHQLEELQFDFCDGLRNVNGFGSIPSLRINTCNHLHDISPLRNNQKVIIRGCRGIIDYSQAFENTKIIELNNSSPIVKLDLHKWRRVQSLTIITHFTEVNLADFYRLPDSVKRCRLEGMISDLIDLTYRPSHLQEISIDENHSITCLETLRALDVPVLALSSLSNLSSLNGLGKRVQCLTLKNNNKLIDYCAVETVHSSLVISSFAKFWTDVNAAIQAKQVIFFHKCQFHNFESLQGKVEILNLLNYQMIPPFSQICNIPMVKLPLEYLSSIIYYISNEGGRVNNQKILIQSKPPRRTSSTDVDQIEETLTSFYKHYLQEEYLMYFRCVDNITFCLFLRRLEN